MATDKYGFDNVSVGTTGWNGILDNNIDNYDLHLHTRLLVTLGENVGAGQPVAILPGGTGWIARRGSDSERKPAIGVAIESGLVTEIIRVQRVGPMTYTGFNFSKIGRPVYLGTSPGTMVQTRPADDIQFLGVATATDTILLGGNVMMESYVEPSTTTTTTTTTTSTTTTSTTTTTTTTTSTTTTTTTTTTTV